MSRRAGRVMLVVVLAGVIALAGAQLWRLDRAREASLAAAQEFETVAQRVSRSVVAARASERSYVAAGQGFAFWQPSVDRTLQGIREDLSVLKAHASTDLTPKLDAVLSALTDVTRLEKRIVEHASAGRIQHASDMIFADGLQASLTLERATDDLIQTHRAALSAQLVKTRWEELALVGAIAGAGLLAALLLLPLPAQAKREESASEEAASREKTGIAGTSTGAAAQPAASVQASRSAEKQADAAISAERESEKSSWDRDRTGPIRTVGLNLSGPPDTLRPASESGGESPSRTGKVARFGSSSTGSHRQPAADVAPQHDTIAARSTLGLSSPSPSPAHESTAAAVLTGTQPSAADTATLSGAAALCSAFAQAADAHDLDSLLPQMAAQLNAVGLIVWLRDEEGHALKAALSHGYPRQTLTALAAIDPDAENATARAARLAQPQVVAASGTTPGALVVPMLTAAGCVGVVSIELPPGREHDESTSALARIFAAQLAMLTA